MHLLICHWSCLFLVKYHLFFFNIQIKFYCYCYNTKTKVIKHEIQIDHNLPRGIPRDLTFATLCICHHNHYHRHECKNRIITLRIFIYFSIKMHIYTKHILINSKCIRHFNGLYCLKILFLMIYLSIDDLINFCLVYLCILNCCDDDF